MIWICCSVEVGLVTGVTGCRCGVVAVVRVALSTTNGCMHSGEWIVRIRRVVKFCVQPIGRGMTYGTVVRQTKLHVGRVLAVGKFGGVARITACRRAFEHIVNVARGAKKCGVRSCQCVPGVFQVVELDSDPVIHAMAGVAGGGEACSDVIKYRCLIVLLMAGEAGCR